MSRFLNMQIVHAEQWRATNFPEIDRFLIDFEGAEANASAMDNFLHVTVPKQKDAIVVPIDSWLVWNGHEFYVLSDRVFRHGHMGSLAEMDTTTMGDGFKGPNSDWNPR